MPSASVEARGGLMAAAAAAAVFACAALAAPPAPPADAVPAQFANDLGPAFVDVSSYPRGIREGYKAFSAKCSQCHTLARPINSEFAEIDDPAEMAKLKKEHPSYFKDQFLLDIKRKIWSRYVHRMMYKPGSGISGPEGKKIWEFLVYDSRYRKLGLDGGGGAARAELWMAHRRSLLDKFKSLHPAKYARLYGQEGLKR